MKAYVGSSLSNWQAARSAMSALRSLGHEIVHDWTIGAERFYLGDHSEKASDIAKACIDGVKACDFAFFLPTIEIAMQGMWAELGAAEALEKPVIAYIQGWNGRERMDCPYTQWLSHKGAFLRHPLVKIFGQYADCFIHLEVIENSLYERRAVEVKLNDAVNEFAMVHCRGFNVGDKVYWAGKPHKILAFNDEFWDEVHACVKAGCSSTWVPVKDLSRFSLN